MKKIISFTMVCMLLLVACGQSYEETKRISRQQRLEAMRKDSAALKIAVMPTLDCLPIYVAQHDALLDTVYGGVRLKMFKAQIDCDTALERGRIEGSVTDLVRALRIDKGGVKLQMLSATDGYWQLITNRNSRIRQLKQLDDKMVAMTRFSATDLLTDRIVDSVKLDRDRVFRVQLNDVGIRLLMLQNNEMDALWMPEPYATAARQLKHFVVYDTRKQNLQLGVLAFREKEMQRPERVRQLDLFVKAWNTACDHINKHGVHHYKNLIAEKMMVRPQVVDSLPADMKFHHIQAPREKDIAVAEKWLSTIKR